MGQKVNPIGLRLGINKNWESRWFPSKDRAPAFIEEDYKIRKFLKEELSFAGVSNVIIERTLKKIRITIVTARPGLVIGKKGADIERFNLNFRRMFQEDISIISRGKKGLGIVLNWGNWVFQFGKGGAFKRRFVKRGFPGGG